MSIAGTWSRPRMLPLLWVGASLGCLACHSPLGLRADARPDGLADSSSIVNPDAAPDVALADRASADLAADATGPELPVTWGAPQAFRIVNRTDRTVYLPTNPYVLCGSPTPGPCSFFDLGCLHACAAVQPRTDCCVECEQPLPAVVALPAGGSFVVPWDGYLHAKATGSCSVCECDAMTAAGSGSYGASTHAYTDYACQRSPCVADSSGLIPMATPGGGETRVVANFQIPAADTEILLVIDWVRGLDAGPPPDTTKLDLPATRDTLPDGVPAAFAALPGHAFEIVANTTPPDASAPWGYPCRNDYPDTIYDLTFSDDATKVHLVSDNVPNHATMDGLLTSTSATSLVYTIDDGWAGAELVVRLDGATLVGQLSIFGSGVPVVFCMESAMQPR